MPDGNAFFDEQNFRAIVGDPAGDTTTTETIAIGETVTSSVDSIDDEDWYAIGLTAGQAIEVSLIGGTLFDPYVYVYDSNGNLVAGDDDISWPTNPDSLLQFVAQTAGTYYISATRYPWDSESSEYYPNTGSYSLTVTEATSWVPSPTSNPLLMDIDWNTQVGANVIDVYFAPAGFSADGYTSEGFNAYEMGQFAIAFDLIETYTNLTINIATDETDAEFVVLLDTNEVNGDFLGYFNPPGEVNQGVGVFDGTQWDRTAGGDLERGGYGFVTIVHEFMHGLGLAHPHDTGGGSTVMDGVSSAFDDYGDYDLNQGVYTTMSYNSGWHLGPAGPMYSGSYGFEGGPMAIDIAALQENYGANGNTNGGDNTYTLPTVNATGTFFEAIWDTGGTDTIMHSGNLAATIDLRAASITEAVGGGGYISAADGIAGGFTVAGSVVIENATGGNGDDTITGNVIGNELRGNGGNDNIIGGGGTDRLFGGTGNDTLDGGDGIDRLYGEDGNDTLLGGGSQDRLDGGEGDDLLDGGDLGDILIGGNGNDTLLGGQGADVLRGFSGDDEMHGGLTSDRLLGYDGNDTLNGDEGNDTLRGGNDDDLAHGGIGNDVVIGGTGRDTLYGDEGNDIIRGTGGFDTVDGGVGNDSVYGGAQADLVLGGAGDDTVSGGGGFDTLNGGTGDDELTGNFNADQFVFEDGHGNDTITDFGATNDFERIDLSAVSAITGLADLELGSAGSGAATQVGSDVLIDTGGGNSILLAGVSLADLDAYDFTF